MALSIKSFVSDVEGSIEVKFDPEGIIPNEIALHILSYIRWPELGKICIVNKSWKLLASHSLDVLDLGELFPSLRIFGKEAWKKHVDLKKYQLCFDGLSPPDRGKLFFELKKFAALSIEDEAGFTLLTIPKGLTYNKLVDISDAKKRNSELFSYTCLDQTQFGNKEVDRSYQALISNNILRGTRNPTIDKYQEILSKPNSELPGLVDIATLVVTSYISDRKHLYAGNKEQGTYTKCSESINNNSLFIGGFLGVCVGNNFDFFLEFDDYGITAFQKLPCVRLT